MCMKEIKKRTIANIKNDIIELHKELSNIPIDNIEARAKKRRSILFAEELIEDLKLEKYYGN